MTSPDELTDTDLLSRAHTWRRHAVNGAAGARDHANAHEAEVRRRFAGQTTVCGLLEVDRPRPPRPFWRFWS